MFFRKIYHSQKIHFLKFMIAGVGTTIIYLGLFSLLWYVFHVNHIISISIAFLNAAAFQFLANRKLTFQINDNNPQHILRYLVFLGINYLLSVIILQSCILAFSSTFIGLVLTCFITPLTGYLFFKYWIFNPSS